MGETLRPLARKYLAAIASRNRFSHRYGVELADAVLALTSAAATPAASVAPASAELLAALPSRPGLARARAPKPPPLELEGEQLEAAGSAEGRRR